MPDIHLLADTSQESSACMRAQVTCEGTMLLEDTEEGGCRASLRGTLRIDLPLIGKRVQQEIVQAAVQHHQMLPQIFERCACMAPGVVQPCSAQFFGKCARPADSPTTRKLQVDSVKSQ